MTMVTCIRENPDGELIMEDKVTQYLILQRKTIIEQYFAGMLARKLTKLGYNSCFSLFHAFLKRKQ